MEGSTPGLVLEYLPLPEGGARLVRAYGETPCLTLPSALPGPEGAPLPLTELGSYAFSDALRDPPAEGLLRCRLDDTGAARLLPLAGQEEELHPIAGRFLEEIFLPDGLRVVGSCAFYNCRALRRLSAGAAPLTLGSDVFLNCFALNELALRASPDQPTGLFALLNSMTGVLRAIFQPEEADEPEAVFWYPEYWEDIEESPAHILLHSFSGQGYHYRQCFLNGKVLCDEYDAIFSEGHDADDATVMALLCLDRLRFPYQLGEAAAGEYRAFLSGKTSAVLGRLLKTEDLGAIRALLALGVMDAAAFQEAAALASRAGNASAAALLADAEYRLRSSRPSPRRARYDFDF